MLFVGLRLYKRFTDMFEKLGILACFAVSTLTLLYQMATKEHLLAAFDKIDAATNDIAEDIRDLKEEIANAGVDQALVDRAESIAAKLEGVAAEYPGQPTDIGSEDDETTPPDLA